MSQTTKADSPDRYVTFRGINFDANMQAVLGHLGRHIDTPDGNNPFWERFRAKLSQIEAGNGGYADKLLLLHAHVYYMRDLFEENDDAAALVALAKLESECF